MARVYELPTHLEVEDVLIAGLTARQLARLMIGLSVAYMVWDSASALPEPVRLLIAGLCVIAGLASALIRPFGRPLDGWLVVAFGFYLAPRCLAWRPVAAVSSSHLEDRSGWADLAPLPDWLSHESDAGRPQRDEVRW